MEPILSDPMRIVAAFLAVLIVMLLLILSRWLSRSGQLDDILASLRPEIQSNLQQLRTFWDQVKPRESNEDEIHRLQKTHYARAYATTPLPPFSLSAYESRLPLITSYKNDRRLIAVTNLYADLARLQEIQRELQSALSAGQRAAAAAARAAAPTDPPARGDGHLAVPDSSAARTDASEERLAQPGHEYDEFLNTAAFLWADAWHRIDRLLASPII